MKLQKLYAPIIFLSLIITLSTHGMEQYTHDLHPLLCFPQEIQQQIVFPSYNATEIDGWQLDALKEVAQTFFIFNILSKEFREHFKLPLASLKHEKKNHILKEVIRCMGVGGVSYKKYRMVPLALIYSGADVDIKPENYSTCLEEAVLYDDERAIAFLLNHNANPYQLDYGEMPICFYATTNDILDLFVEKVDKKEVLKLSKLEDVVRILLQHWCPPAIMVFWLDYSESLRAINQQGECIFHRLAHHICIYGAIIEDAFAKGELLLKRIPDLINCRNSRGETPIDLAWKEGYCLRRDRWLGVEKIIDLFRQYGGKTAQELEAESIAIV